MTEVLVERTYPEPLTEEVMGRNLANALVCLDLHHVQWRRSLLSPDRCELVCHFTARDAESVRLALQQAGARRGLVWSGTVHDAPGVTEADVLEAGIYACRTAAPGDLFDPQRMDEAAHGDNVDRLAEHGVRLVRSYVSNDRRRMIGLYRAPDVESVRLALRGAGGALVQVWPCHQLLP